MKKLMIVLAAVAMVTAAQANTLLWGINPSYNMDDTKFANASVYLMYSAAVPTLPAPAGADESGNVNVAKFTTSDLTSGSQLLTGTMTAGAFEGNQFIDSLSGKTYFYLAVISDDGKYMAISTTTKTANMSTATSNNTLKWLGTTQMKVYTASSVPEPTSGLLMLVGLGALALRRRKA